MSGRDGEHDEMLGVMPPPVVLDAKVVATLPEPSALREAGRAPFAHPGCFGGIDAVRRFRPFARRRFSTFRPPGVAMRARNPCVLFRRRLLG